jgi:hypothetical protein
LHVVARKEEVTVNDRFTPASLARKYSIDPGVPPWAQKRSGKAVPDRHHSGEAAARIFSAGLA